MRLFAVCTPGLEDVLCRELTALPGVSSPSVVKGGVEWTGDRESVWRANLRLRTASRVLVRLGEIRARDFARLRREAERLPWERYAAGPVVLDVRATAQRCRLYHSGAIAERIAAAAQARLAAAVGLAAPRIPAGKPEPLPPPRREPLLEPLRLIVRGENDVFTISVDSSGELLHRRGYREETAKAPLRETLAAGLLLLSGWDPAVPLFDPTCGSGTIVLEAALLALRRAPGAGRAFAFERWPDHDATRWRALVEEAARAELPAAPAPLRGADRDAGAVEAARRNAARARLEAHVSFEAVAVERAEPPTAPCLILANPPYGRRVYPAAGASLRHLYRALGDLARRAPPGSRLAILASDPALARSTGLPVRAEFPLVNGGVPVRLYVFAPAR